MKGVVQGFVNGLQHLKKAEDKLAEMLQVK